MRTRNFIITIFIVFIQTLVFGQTSESQYFYHQEYFNYSTIKEKKIKSISVTSYWTSLKGALYQEEKTIYSFTEVGELLCSKIYYFKETDPNVITRQTIDCYEYENNLQFRHFRYHNNKDSAEWIEEFEYELDQNRNITKIFVKDLSYPHNSKTTEKFYDSKNRIITEKTDFGYLTEYQYDSVGNLIERVWGSKKGPRNRNIYSYDTAGNLIKYEFRGTPFDNYDIVTEINQYDMQNRIVVKESISAENETSIMRYNYHGTTNITIEYLNTKGDIINITTKNFEQGLIRAVFTEKDGKVLAKEIFEYEFYKN